MRWLILFALLLASPAVAEDGYRLDNYRAPTPAGLDGARVIDTNEAKALWEGGQAVFIDVLPAILGQGLHQGRWLVTQPRRHIPGSLWLPNVGKGVLDPEIEAYFRAELAKQPSDRPLVFYCLADCWMSWNAAKRAMAWGRGRVVWYPTGTDGWAEAGLPLEEGEPVALR
jgi:PQQ-dependent catabolism-associated CXXCW motif protein